MGRLIDTSELAKHIALQKKRFGNLLEVPICNVFADMIRDTPTAKAIPKADYENRLKADMSAMLTDLSMEIGEIEDGYVEFDEENKRSLSMIPLESVDRLIQQKINELKADKGMKLEIDIDEDYYKIICKRVQDNKPFHSPYEYEVIADGKPLEQKPILDKIRAEIEAKIVKRPWLDFEDRERDRNDAFLEVLDIIDKYKADQEGKE